MNSKKAILKENLELSKEIDKRKIPEHVAIIMDGNGRWATKKGLPRSFGHNKGVSVLKKIIKFPYLKTNYFFKRNFKLMSQIVSKGFENRNKSKCGFQEIMKELITYNAEAEKSFKTSLKDCFVFSISVRM